MREKLNSYSIRFLTTLLLCGAFVSPGYLAATLPEQTEVNCYASLMTAMRAWNYPKFKETLHSADRVGIIQPWQKEYGQNLLDGCDRNAILLTHNLVDTLPLLYLQHIKKIRQDVAILPIIFLDKTWYLNLLQQGDPFICNRPEVGLNRRQIIQLNTEDILPDWYEFGISKNVCREYQIDSSQNIIRLDLDVGWYTSRANYSSESIKLVLNLFAQNRWRRPVFVSSTCDSIWLRQVQDRLRCEGLIYRVSPCCRPDQTMDYDWQKIASLLKDPDRFIYYREANQALLDTTAFYCNLAEKLIQHERLTADPQDVHEILSLLSDNIGFSYLIAPDTD